MVTVLVDNTHKEDVNVRRTDDDGFSEFGRSCAGAGITLETISNVKDISLDRLRRGAVLMVAFPKARFSKAEYGVIHAFVHGGGGLLLTGEWGNIHNSADTLNDLSKPYGLTFNADRIADKVSAHHREIKFGKDVVGTEVVPQFPRIRDFRKHPITHGIREVGHFSGCSIGAPDSAALAWSSPTAFGDLNADAELDPGEKQGFLVTAAVTHDNGGRVVAVGDTSLLLNKHFASGDNGRYLVNILLWLAKALG